MPSTTCSTLTLTDASNEITGESTATLKFASTGMKEIALDLTSKSGGAA